MGKKGFAFIETVIAITILSTSLLLVYSSFKSITNNVKKRLYYDDINYIYRSNYIKVASQKVLDEYISKNINYINVPKDELVNDEMVKDFEVNNIVLIKKDELKNFKKCLKNNCGLDLSSTFKDYLKQISIDLNVDYIIAIEYQSNNSFFYSWVGA